jgi:hypothetical protein
MITAVNFRPKFYSSGYNPIIWSVTSDLANDNLIDYAYVFDVYVDGVKVNRIVQRPNPAFAGMIDVRPIVEPYLTIGTFANETGALIAKPFKVGSTACASVYIYVGEQYRLNATDLTPTLYNGLGNTSGDQGQPAYFLGADGPILMNSKPVIVLPSSLPWSQQQDTMQVTTNNLGDYFGLFGYLAPYVLKNNSIFAPTTCGGQGLFLSQMPRTSTGGAWQTTSAAPDYNFSANDYAYDRRTVTFLNRNPVYQYGGQLQSSAPKVAWFEFYDSDGANIGEYAIANYQDKGGAPREFCNSNISTFSTSNNEEFLSLRVGPKDLEDLGVWTQLGEVAASYTVQLYANLTINSGCNYSGVPTNPLSELVTVNVTEDCTSYLYPRVRLVWLNSLGGRDYWNFTMFAEEQIEAKGQEFYQAEMNWSGVTPVVLTTPVQDTTNNWLKGGIRSYNKSVNTTYTITTDWLTQDEVELIKNSVQSPQIWGYIGQEDFPYTAKIKETNYIVKTIKQVKMYTVTFNVEFSTEQSMQTT